MKIFAIFIIFSFGAAALFSVVEETASLQNFVYGETAACEYDNWQSHIAEGIADPGYNLYASWDVQTNGFGGFIIPSEDDLSTWELIIDEFLLGNLDAAQSMINDNAYPYEVVIFNDTDSERIIYMLREIPNNEYYDDNQTQDPDDDELGAFDYGWGLFLYYPEGNYPNIVSAPHPNDDYFTIPLALKAFIDTESKFLLISGTGREVVWTGVGNYDNSKSLCDPTRQENNIFNVCYQKFCDKIRTDFSRHEFSLQLHSYDWGNRHQGYPNVQISAGYYVGSPDLPIRDHSTLGLDIVNASEQIIHPANSVGLHSPVHLNDFYGFHSSEYEFNFTNSDTTFAVNTSTDLWGYSNNRQIVYTQSGMSQYDNFERFLHLEMDELPNVYPQTTNNYFWFHGWNPVTQTWDMQHKFDKAIAYYSPWIDALAEVLPLVFEMNNSQIPVSPTNLEIITECSNYIKIKWDKGDCFDMDTYEILYSTEPISNGGYSVVDKSSFNKLACLSHNSYSLSGLNPGEGYYFAVRIKDKNGNESELSNEVFGSTGPAAINNFFCYGRDEKILLEWKATSSSAYYGFNIYRKTQQSDFTLIDSWLMNPELAGFAGDNVPYNYQDQNVTNGQVYTYKIGFEDNENEYLFADEHSAASHKIYQIFAAQSTGILADTCYFGYNDFAADGYDLHFDLEADDQTGGEYFFCQFYEEYWGTSVPENYEQEIRGLYDSENQLKSWIYRVRTDQVNTPIEIGISNLDRNGERFYLYSGSQFTNLAETTFSFTPTNSNYYSFVLYWGNLTPSVEFDFIPNQLFYPNETLDISWIINVNANIDHVNVYAENDQITIPIELELFPTNTTITWNIPQLLFEDLKCRIDLVMEEGDTLNYYSPYSFGIISSQNIVQTYAGWNPITKNFDADQFTTEQIFGENTVFYEFNDSNFIEAGEPEFLHPYWLYAPQDNYFAISNATLQKLAYSVPLDAGWNIIPNPHRASYDLDQLVFSVNNVDYEYYQAVQNRLIEPLIFDYDQSFKAVSNLTSSKAYYLYCYEDNITVKFIPYYSNEFSPEYLSSWKATINVEQQNNDISSIVVGTSEFADSLYNSNYDLLKPLHKPYQNGITFYLPMEVNGSIQKMHQSIAGEKDQTSDYSYFWNAELQLADPEQLYFTASTFDIPQDARIFLGLSEGNLEIPATGFVEYTPADTVLDITVIITNRDYSNVDVQIVPDTFTMHNYPNPFNPQTNIQYNIPKDGKVELSIYNIKGQKVKTLVDGLQLRGEHTAIWDGRNNNDKKVATGVYFYKLNLDNSGVLINKMLLLK
ncbi:MAG: T9SS type A sorting domain-containing protein [Candidatus Cloacimonetes bacterium]|nr:T9SS type A sorting domain-containing protein [Candidatus Cloacimonadota bacterium]